MADKYTFSGKIPSSRPIFATKQKVSEYNRQREEEERKKAQAEEAKKNLVARSKGAMVYKGVTISKAPRGIAFEGKKGARLLSMRIKGEIGRFEREVGRSATEQERKDIRSIFLGKYREQLSQTLPAYERGLREKGFTVLGYSPEGVPITKEGLIRGAEVEAKKVSGVKPYSATPQKDLLMQKLEESRLRTGMSYAKPVETSRSYDPVTGYTTIREYNIQTGEIQERNEFSGIEKDVRNEKGFIGFGSSSTSATTASTALPDQSYLRPHIPIDMTMLQAKEGIGLDNVLTGAGAAEFGKHFLLAPITVAAGTIELAGETLKTIPEIVAISKYNRAAGALYPIKKLSGGIESQLIYARDNPAAFAGSLAGQMVLFGAGSRALRTSPKAYEVTAARSFKQIVTPEGEIFMEPRDIIKYTTKTLPEQKPSAAVIVSGEKFISPTAPLAEMKFGVEYAGSFKAPDKVFKMKIPEEVSSQAEFMKGILKERVTESAQTGIIRIEPTAEVFSKEMFKVLGEQKGRAELSIRTGADVFPKGEPFSAIREEIFYPIEAPKEFLPKVMKGVKPSTPTPFQLLEAEPKFVSPETPSGMLSEVGTKTSTPSVSVRISPEDFKVLRSAYNIKRQPYIIDYDPIRYPSGFSPAGALTISSFVRPRAITISPIQLPTTDISQRSISANASKLDMKINNMLDRAPQMDIKTIEAMDIGLSFTPAVDMAQTQDLAQDLVYKQKSSTIKSYQYELPKAFIVGMKRDSDSSKFGRRLKRSNMFKLSEVFDVLVKSKGKFSLAASGLKYSDALDVGAMSVDTSSSARFKLVKRLGMPRVSPVQKGYYSANISKFRPYRINRGRKIGMNLEFIERSGSRIDTSGEKQQITALGIAAVKRNKKGRVRIWGL